MKIRKSIVSALCLVLILALCFSGCSKRSTETEAPAEEDIVTVTETPVAPETEPQPTLTPTAQPDAQPAVEATPVPADAAYTNPLTGEPMTEDISMLRPLAVMFNNHEGALPQCGISSADIIYEMCEEGITRMLGIFSHMPECERFGSIRSARPYHIDVAMSYDAIFIHWGRSERAADLLWSTGIDHIEFNENPAQDYAYRDYTHGNGAVEHTGFVTIENLKKFISDKNWRTEHTSARSYGFQFADELQLTGGSAESVTVAYAGKRSEFTYDASRGGYTMSQYGNTVYKDGDTGAAPVFRNILVLRAPIYDETGIASMQLTNIQGTGYLFCDGQYQEITWMRGPSYDDSFEYYNADGTPLVLGVGKTFIPIISNSDTVTF